MKKMMGVMLVVSSVVIAYGCQQQGRPGSAKSSKGLQSVHFDFDQAEIKAEFKNALKSNSKYLKDNPKEDVAIEGHCDERGTPEYNIALGHRRANATKQYMVSLGVDRNRMKTKSFGEEKPAEKCHNESCWWKNRRADFKKQ